LRFGAIAAGHEDTAAAAAAILRAGGNAFDAALAAMCSACVAEPVLASLGGGGFLLARSENGETLLYDFFVQTPQRRLDLSVIDFRPITADFGDAQQEFHIGLGAAATPGAIRGLFRIHRDLCRLPLELIVQPAAELARRGAAVNRLQHYIATIVEPILRATPEAFDLHRSPADPARLAGVGERTPWPDFADTLESLAREGEDLFHRGEIGRRLVQDCREQGGYLSAEDLLRYRVEIRRPLRLDYRDAELATNPPPSMGGLLLGFTLGLMRESPLHGVAFAGPEHLRLVARAMALTQRMRSDCAIHERLHDAADAGAAIDGLAAEYGSLIRAHPVATRGTTQISIIDRHGNLASMTLSNGEGCGYVLPGTGIMLNNMLGEEDVNPHGFHRWPENRRIASMMAPSALQLGDGRLVALGSGGSNRIRGAILQVLSNLVDFALAVRPAVEAPRIHFEDDLLNLEPPHDAAVLRALADEFPRQRPWNATNLFFGGVHTVMRHPDGRLEGAGDPRRGGVYRAVDG